MKLDNAAQLRTCPTVKGEALPNVVINDTEEELPLCGLLD